MMCLTVICFLALISYAKAISCHVCSGDCGPETISVANCSDVQATNEENGIFQEGAHMCRIDWQRMYIWYLTLMKLCMHFLYLQLAHKMAPTLPLAEHVLSDEEGWKIKEFKTVTYKMMEAVTVFVTRTIAI